MEFVILIHWVLGYLAFKNVENSIQHFFFFFFFFVFLVTIMELLIIFKF